MAWPPRPAAVAPASAPVQTEAARPPTPRDHLCPVDTALAPRLAFLCLSTNHVTPASPAPYLSSLPGTGRRWRVWTEAWVLWTATPAAWADVGQGHELREDPWSWASGWGLGALCSSTDPSAHLATSSSPANARTWLPHPQNLQAIAPRLGTPPCLGW